MNQYVNLINLLEHLGLNIVKFRKDEIHIICPWHDDKTASLYVNPYKWTHICFAGCTKGSVNSLVKKIAGWNYSLYLPLLKKIPRFVPTDNFVAVPNFDYFNNLPKAENNSYLQHRGIDGRTIEIMDIRATKTSVIFPVYSKEKIHYQCAGACASESFFCGYIERITENWGIRYKHSPGFSVERHFYPNVLDFPQKASIILVEGPFDCLKLRQAGFLNSLAILGTNLSDYKFKFLLSLTKEIKLCFDNDFAGKMATHKLFERLYAKNMNVDVIKLPTSVKDLGELEINSIQKIIELAGEKNG